MRDAILKAFPQLEEGDALSCSMGANGQDVILSPAAFRLFPYSIETKARATFTVFYGYYDQAKGHGKGEPLLVIKGDRRKPLAIVDLEHFLEITKGKLS